ncbi:sigma-70 family RNA polymerase sigma factor [Heliobacterium gestii]|uniref:Sigma-70 family RNA polymerase sigma factor n=1 Tax=Heliomicrobium gestii TaxID=2699 RepID=A0A845L6Q8_HELGE|nr:sigma-70 family RNA polymerase sigma factor [Heliomicrobium gestii]MBM7865658.1 RNA polymerase sigma-70 factor (ECF subfamily) [Heliomicrobium gestii]MZP41908.1 sigma-70 family RNA polymerase sigma factor [Heliomicrobium gestii]
MDIDRQPIDQSTFCTVYASYYPKIYKYILRRVGNVDLASDLAGQTFEQAFVKKVTYQPERGTISSWLYAIAHNIIVDYRRSSKTMISLEALPSIPGSAEINPETITLSKEATKQLLEAMAKLNERERKVITLKYASGLANRKIATIMNLSDRNVGVILYRTLRKLRRMLEKNENYFCKR